MRSDRQCRLGAGLARDVRGARAIRSAILQNARTTIDWPALSPVMNRDSRVYSAQLSTGGLQSERDIRGVKRQPGQLGQRDQIEVIGSVKSPGGDRGPPANATGKTAPNA